MNEKQQQLLYDKGISQRPFDLVSDDNCLQTYKNMYYRDGEHRLIQHPKQYISGVNKTLLAVHHIGTVTNYLFINGTTISWGRRNSDGTLGTLTELLTNVTDTPSVNISGKTISIVTPSGITYFQWESSLNAYKNLGNKLPEVKIRFSLNDWKQSQYGGGGVTYEEKCSKVWADDDGTIGTDTTGGFVWLHRIFEVRKQKEFNDAVTGILYAHLNDIKKAKRFCFPFWIRYAIRLFDGSYANISAPILMYPSSKMNRLVYIGDTTGYYYHEAGWRPDDSVYGISCDPYSAKLQFKVEANSAEIDNLRDYIAGVDVFASTELPQFDADSNWSVVPPSTDRQFLLSDFAGDRYSRKNAASIPSSGATWENREQWTTYLNCNNIPDNQYRERLLNNMLFYKIFELKLSDLKNSATREASEFLTETTLLNLNTNKQLTQDDYFSHAQNAATAGITYNGRLILFDLKRSIYQGDDFFSSWKMSSGALTFRCYVYLDTVDGEKIVMNRYSSTQTPCTFFFYPDPRAKKAELYYEVSGGGVKLIKSMDLVPHPQLNGAYYLPDNRPSGDSDWTSLISSATTATAPTESSDLTESLSNQLYVSEVDNPITFRASGNLTAGLGTIINVSTLTTALSQGQFGQYPLIIFSTDGIYAASLNSEGVFTAVHPMSREICNNAKSVTQTDGAIFFSSNKGLMRIIGNEVKCVSEQMGSDFVDDLRTLLVPIAYDYRDSLLWINAGPYWYVYNMKMQTFSTYDRLTHVSAIVTDYPDTLIHDGTYIYSILKRPLPENDSYRIDAQMITRPMKLENAFALKSILQVRNIFYSPDGDLAFGMRILASNNLDTWVELSSLRGQPWKYYKFQFDLGDMAANDSFAGTMLVTQERRTNKLR